MVPGAGRRSRLLLAVLALTVASGLVAVLTLWRHSEAERLRAENALARAIASDKVTSEAVRDLVGLLTMNVDVPQMLVSERILESSHVVRDLTAKLRQDPGVAVIEPRCDSAALKVNWQKDFRAKPG